jgi:putative transposase
MTDIHFDWPKPPSHKLKEKGTFIVTGETPRKQYLFDTPEKLDRFQEILFKLALQFQWQLEAWALFSNHYHVLISSKNPTNLDDFVDALHQETTETLNRIDSESKRKVWANYFINKVTMQATHYAFLNYVHYNPIKHRLVKDATTYRWCSAGWFEKNNEAEHITKIKSFGSKSFGINNLTIVDDYA